MRYGIPLLTFYSFNPAKMERYEPYMSEWQDAQKTGMSETGWTNGLYVAQAIGATFSKSGKYPDSPLELYRSVSADGDEDEEPVHKFTDADRFGAWAAMFNKSREVNEAKKAEAIPADSDSEAPDTSKAEPLN